MTICDQYAQAPTKKIQKQTKCDKLYNMCEKTTIRFPLGVPWFWSYSFQKKHI